MSDEPRPGCQPFKFDGGPIGILLQHGFTGCPASMRPMGEWLNQQGLSVVGPLLPGHGTRWEDLEDRTWPEWERESERALLELAERCSTVFAAGLSMGGAMVMHLAVKHPEKIRGVIVINADLIRPELALAAVMRLFVRTWKGVGNDIKKPGQNELPYERIPMKALVQLGKFYRVVRKELPSLRQPLLVFSSKEDHVVKSSVAPYIAKKAGSERKQLIRLTNSYHVATLDYDAEICFQRVLGFVNTLAGETAPSA